MKKRKSQAGFTLVELLAVILILVLVTALVAGGMPYLEKSYIREMDAANSRVLLSTTMTELRTRLSTGRQIEIDGTQITWINGATGEKEIIQSTEDGIMITEHPEYDGGIARLLVSKQAASGKFHAEFESAAVENGILTISNLAVYKDGEAVVTNEEFKIKIAGNYD